MRSFLYWIARMIVGVATLSLAFTLLGGAPGEVIGSAVVLWILALLVGMVLSAPYAVAPPGTSMGFSFSLPIVAWIFLFAFIIIGWIGRWVLTAGWGLIALVWRPAAPVPAGVPSGPAQVAGPAAIGPGIGGPGIGGPGAGRPGGVPSPPPVGPSWQRDPTGRHLQRYWDGQQWTGHVADGSATAIDPYRP